MASAGQSVPVLLVGAGSPVGRSIAAALAARGAEARQAASVYDAVVALARRPQAAGVVMIDVDGLLEREMAVFGFLRRRWPQVALAAYGSASSGRRLAAAAAAGAATVLAGPVDNGQLDDLLGPAAAAARPEPIQAPASAPDAPRQPPAARPATGAYRDLLTEAEMNALLGDGSDVPVAGRQDAEPPEGRQ
jgi:DNA-binding NtrC family response regulator